MSPCGSVRDFQVDREPSLSREPKGGPDGTLVNCRKGALHYSGTEKGIGSATTKSIVAVPVQFVLTVVSISLGKFCGEGCRTSWRTTVATKDREIALDGRG
jgi:hypothetical protein